MRIVCRRLVRLRVRDMQTQFERIPSRVQRPGFSLIEVILATAILLGSVIVLSELAGIGRRQSNRAEQISEAQRLCELTLHEIVLGLRPIESLERAPLLAVPVDADVRGEIDLFGEIDPASDAIEAGAGLEPGAESEWTYSVRFEPVESWPSLTALTVEVEPANDDRARFSRFSLTRWIDTSRVEPNSASTEFGAVPANDLFADEVQP